MNVTPESALHGSGRFAGIDGVLMGCVRRLTVGAMILCAAAPWMVGCADMQHRPADNAGYGSAAPASRQILLMLRETVHAHYQPGASYVSAYDEQTPAPATSRVERVLDEQFRLHQLDHWPMPALGVHCFVERVDPSDTAEQVVRRLSADPRVESAQTLQEFHLLSSPSTTDSGAPAQGWGSMQIVHQWATGRGVLVAQIDTGVEVLHPNLAPRLLPMVDMVGGARVAAELHGTAVAGVLVAQPLGNQGWTGVAPAATLLPLRACWQQAPGALAGVCNSFTLAKAMQYALVHHAQVVNLSLSGPQDGLLSRLIEQAVARGVVVVAAVDPQAGDGGFPANRADVLAVSSIGDGCRVRAFLAPGHHVLTTAPPDGWTFVNGNSFATAEISGLVALTLERAPASSPAQVFKLLRDTSGAGNLAAPEQGTVDPCALMAELQHARDCVCCTHAQAFPGAWPALSS